MAVIGGLAALAGWVLLYGQRGTLDLDQMGAAAAILGKSLYTGALDLAACVRRYEKKGSQL